MHERDDLLESLPPPAWYRPEPDDKAADLEVLLTVLRLAGYEAEMLK